jgi:hypothetical protein
VSWPRTEPFRCLIAVLAKLCCQFAPLLGNTQQRLLHGDVSSVVCPLFEFASPRLVAKIASR